MNTTTDTLLTEALGAVDAELHQASQELAELERKRSHLLMALGEEQPQVITTKGRTPKVIDAELFTNAVRELGGEATNAELVTFFNVENGNALTGGRTAALRRGDVTYDDGVYTVANT